MSNEFSNSQRVDLSIHELVTMCYKMNETPTCKFYNKNREFGLSSTYFRKATKMSWTDICEKNSPFGIRVSKNKLKLSEIVDFMKGAYPDTLVGLNFLEDWSTNGKILASTKYGRVWVHIATIKGGAGIGIHSAIDKTDYFKNMLKEKNYHVYTNYTIDGEYVSMKDKIRLISKYGAVNTTADLLLSGHIPSIKTAEDKNIYFLNQLKELNPEFYYNNDMIGEYVQSGKKIDFTNRYGVVSITPESLFGGNGADIRSAINKNSYISNMFMEVHSDTYDYSKVQYTVARKKVIIICKEHGEFLQYPYSHIAGNGCPLCYGSKGEKTISNFLNETKIVNIPQHSFDDCRNINKLLFDFYLCDLNILIEYDGRQHYFEVEYFGGYHEFEKRKVNDKIKNDYCKKNNIKLIRIPYWEFENIEEILREELNLKED